jgi:hypothetical protein
MDDQQDGCGPSAREIAPDCERSAPHRSAPATGPPPDVPAALLERLELRMRVAELTTVTDTIAAALRDARAAGLRVGERHERLAASAAAAGRLLRAIAARLR